MTEFDIMKHEIYTLILKYKKSVKTQETLAVFIPSLTYWITKFMIQDIPYLDKKNCEFYFEQLKKTFEDCMAFKEEFIKSRRFN